MKKEFTATLQQSQAKGGWTYLVWPESVESFDPGSGPSLVSRSGDA